MLELGIARRVTPFNNQYLFAGQLFNWRQIIVVPGATTLNYQILVGSTRKVHLVSRSVITQTLTSAVTVNLFEGSTFTVGATTQTIFNSNLASSTTSMLTIYSDSVLTLAGTKIESAILISQVPFVQYSPEIILKGGTSYQLQIIHNPAGNVNVDFDWIWYESRD